MKGNEGSKRSPGRGWVRNERGNGAAFYIGSGEGDRLWASGEVHMGRDMSIPCVSDNIFHSTEASSPSVKALDSFELDLEFSQILLHPECMMSSRHGEGPVVQGGEHE